MKNCPKGWSKSRDLLLKFRDPLISLEPLKIHTSNYARGLKVRDLILNKKNAKLVNTGRGLDHVTFDFDFQHGYQMWTWFVNFLDQEKTKINFKN